MSASASKATTVRAFNDPDHYRAALFGGGKLYHVLGRGSFDAQMTDVEVGHVKVQHGRESLPRLATTSIPANKTAIVLWDPNGRLPVVRGMQPRPGELLCAKSGMQSHHRTTGAHEFTALLLDSAMLADAARHLTGRDLAVAGWKLLRPPEPQTTRLRSLARSAFVIGDTAPEILLTPASAKALESALLQTIIGCLQHPHGREGNAKQAQHAVAAKKLQEAIEANLDSPLHLLDLCRISGLPARTLRNVFQEQMGVSPMRFLALRRLHMARQSLLQADPRSTTVTEIATQYGIWEFGRFSVAYRTLFGELPSATLRRPPQQSN